MGFVLIESLEQLSAQLESLTATDAEDTLGKLLRSIFVKTDVSFASNDIDRSQTQFVAIAWVSNAVITIPMLIFMVSLTKITPSNEADKATYCYGVIEIM